ncbi:MAG: cofactor-independent phosphoglycerate mutase [Dehalococcoidia bacterium]|nr:cofactor-independent phosphoglycerate mutase [Dehalococcoidia bacterium]
MKFCIVIVDGASGWPLAVRDNKTCLELALTPNLDRMAGQGYSGMALTIPPGMEPGSAPACMSVLGYDPTVYYRGRSAIEARSVGVPIGPGDVTFRCNLVTIIEGKMVSHSAGHISTGEAVTIIDTLNEKLGSGALKFFPGISYRHICRISGHENALMAVCTPPHDITDRQVGDYLPRGRGSELLNELMKKSESVLEGHPVNEARKRQGKLPVTSIWLFWPSGRVPEMPSFQEVRGLRASLTSGVDLLRGLAIMAGIEVLHIDGVTDNLDNDFSAQAEGALGWLNTGDLVVMHIEAPDEMGHRGSIIDKIKAIELIDREVISKLLDWKGGQIRVLVMPDHPTPIELKTHSAEPVPFLIWGGGVKPNGAARFTEAEAGRTGISVEPGFKLMDIFLKDK